jgi:hypothetical protein
MPVQATYKTVRVAKVYRNDNELLVVVFHPNTSDTAIAAQRAAQAVTAPAMAIRTNGTHKAQQIKRPAASTPPRRGEEGTAESRLRCWPGLIS